MDRAAGRLGEVCVVEPDATQSAEKHIGHRGKPRAQLVGAHGGRRRAVGKEVGLTLLDAVFHVAAGAVDLLVEIAGLPLGPIERGDDEARIALVLGMLSFGDDPAAAPTVSRVHMKSLN
jgi:hypothetical protein